MKLYGNPMSTCTRKVLTVLAEKGHKAEFVLVDFAKGEQKQPAHLARQPFGVVPAIDDNGFQLFESRAICRYLDETLPGTKLTPADAKGRAIMEQWISIEQSYFTSAAMKVVRQGFFHPLFGQPVDQAVLEEGRAATAKQAAIIDKLLGGNDY